MTNHAADGLTPRAAIDRIEAAIPPRPQDRRLHARGAVYDARFVPSGQIDNLTIATHLRNETPAVVRFSNGGGFDADDRSKGVRGMAVKFLADGHAVADLAAANTLTFPARTPEGFVALVELLSKLQSGPVGRLQAVPMLLSILVKHPETGRALLGGAAKPPASFATTRFNGLNTFSSSTPTGSGERFVIDSCRRWVRPRWTLNRPTRCPTISSSQNLTSG